MRVPFSFLAEQFENPEPVFQKLKALLKRCDFTLGEDLEEFEKRYADYCGIPYALGVGNGTDAIALALLASGVMAGDEVITVANSFVATTGAIVQSGAKPVFIDAGTDLNIDCEKIESAITERTTAIVPVHWAGRPADVERIREIAEKHKLVLVEDCCQALGSKVKDRHVGTFGVAGAFSVHPIKPLHVWGDGGVIITKDEGVAKKLKLLRNHGLEGRDTVRCFGFNSRMDTLQAVVGNYVFESLDATIDKRIEFAELYTKAFSGGELSQFVKLPEENPSNKNVYHLYQIRVDARDKLLGFLNGNGVEAKVHYPIPLHLQPASAYLGYKKGDFPNAEAQSEHTITLPCHQFLTFEQIDYAIECVKKFFLR